MPQTASCSYPYLLEYLQSRGLLHGLDEGKFQRQLCREKGQY